MPGRVAAEGDAENEVLGDVRGGGGGEDVRSEMVHELGGVGRGAVDAAEHVLCVARVALPPRLVVQLVDESGAMVALVEGDGEETGGGVGGTAGVDACVPGGYYGGGDGGHLLGGLEARVEEPEAGDGGRCGWELGEAMDGGADAGDGVGVRGDGGQVGGGALERVVGSCHCVAVDAAKQVGGQSDDME